MIRHPFICMEPSPTIAISGAGRVGDLAPMTYGTPVPMVASVSGRDRAWLSRMRRCVRTQLAAEA